MRLFWSVVVACCGLGPSFHAAGQVVITEFVASNTTGLRDGDGDRSDWIELYNPALTPVNLGGWSLTDDPENLAKWRFPATNLAARTHLLVFASGKDRAMAGAELHASFKLDAAGGYLALVRPGPEIASAYRYPPQKDNVAYGSSLTTTTNQLVPERTAVKFLVPPDGALGLTWTGGSEPFDDSGWFSGVTGIGYDTNAAGAGLILETVGEPAVARPVNDSAIGSIFVLAMAGFSQAGDVTDWLMYSTTTLAITPILMRLETNGSYIITGIGSTRTSTGRGAQTNAFGLVSGSARVGPGYFFGWKDGSNGGNNPGVPVWTDGTGAGVRWFQQHTTFAVNEGLGAGQFFNRAYSLQARIGGTLLNLARTNVQSLMFGVNPSLYLRATFTVPAGQTFDSLTLCVNYDDGFVAWLNGVEVLRRNAPTPLSFNSTAITNRSVAAAIGGETIDLSAFAGALRSGANVLAIQALNDQVDSGEFLMLPELTSVRTDAETNRFLPVPTPGAPNGTGLSGWVADTKFTPNRGIYWEPIEVAITNGTPGAVIRFTTDGSWPGETNGTIYTAPIPITNTTAVRAAAFRPGFIPTDVDTHTYLFPARVAGQPINPPGFPASWSGSAADYEVDPNVTGTTLPGYHLTNALLDLPSISITADRGDLFDAARGIYYNSANSGPAWRRPASVELIFPDGRAGWQAEVVLRMAGDASSGQSFTPKHSMRIAFRNELGEAKLHFPLFPDSDVADFDQIEFRACSTDSWPVEEGYLDNGVMRWVTARATYMRDQYMRDTLRDLGQPTSHGRYVQLYLNGLYWGLYNLVEWMNDGWNEAHFGGDKSEYDVIKDYAELEEGNYTAWNEMLSLVNAGFPTETEYQRLLGNNPDGTRNPAYPVYLNVANFIDYMLTHIYGGAEDWPGHNWWGSRRRGPLSEGFRFYAWDQEISNDSLVRTQVISAFGNTRFEAVNYPNSPAIIYDRLRRNSSFQQRFIDRVQEVMFGNGALTPLACSNRWVARQTEIDRAIVGESARWGDRRREPPFKRDTNWLGEMSWQANFWASNHTLAVQRFRSVGLYPLLGPPLFSPPGGLVPAGFLLSIANTNGSGLIYFTTDGSDPRLANGNVAPQAQTYLEPYTISGQVLLRARIRSGTNWSAIVSATFVPPQDLSPLVLTEIMYNPPGAGLVSGDEFEFLELKNTGATSLDLGGLTFTEGINFTFTNGTQLAPGAFFVLARNKEQFQSRYPGVPVNGVYGGHLDNGGETLTLSHAISGPIFSVTYDDTPAWPQAADGLGFSLVPSSTTASLNSSQPQHWRASRAPGGSPGADDPAPGLPAVVINEVLTHTTASDFIELFNLSASPANVGGWFLTDDPGVPKKFRIPDGTTIAGGGYLVFTESSFNPAPGLGTSFTLSADGEQVFLFSGDATTNLTGYSHGFTFGAAAQGTNSGRYVIINPKAGSNRHVAAAEGASFGRYVISTGEEQFPAQILPTMGGANSGPLIADVVINEIHYNPHPGDDAFVEIKNRTASPVTLYDSLRPTNTWRLNGIDFTFPTNIVLPGGGLALIVGTPPADFRVKYNVSAGVPIFGPYTGALQNSGELLEFQRLEFRGTNNLAWVTFDAVRYNDRAPWPAAADGAGASLQRVNPAAYGNDPVNWFAAAPTPGADGLSGLPPAITSHPVSRTNGATTVATFSVSATGIPPISYQWRANGRNLDGATNSTLVLPNVRLADAGQYQAVVFNATGSTDSSNALLRVFELDAVPPGYESGIPGSPSVTSDPQSQTVLGGAGFSSTFSVTASGDAPLSYRWLYGYSVIANATNASLILNDIQVGQQGNYRCVVLNNIGYASSSNALLTVLIPPAITQQPANVDIRVRPDPGTDVAPNTNAAILLAATSFNPPLTFQWRMNGTNLFASGHYSNVNAPTLIISNVSMADFGDYSCALNDSYGTIISSNATLYPLVRPTILLPSPNQTQTVVAGSLFPVSAVLSNGWPPPFGYQWRSSGSAIITNIISNSKTNFFVYPGNAVSTNVLTGALYRLVVTNRASPTVLVNVPFYVTTLLDTDHDGIPDSVENALGLDANNAADALLDLDGDGMTNLAEYQAGTDPANPASTLRIEHSILPGTATLRFSAVSNRTYTIQFSDSLRSGSWSKLADFVAVPTNRIEVLIDPGWTTSHFYRVVTPRQPSP